jgi:imidazoleglycerol phosphate synthase cyclase subunit
MGFTQDCVEWVMLPKRVIARLDVKGESLVKGIQLEGLRKIGDPLVASRVYYEQGIDEVVIVDVVASLYSRNHLFELISYITSELRVPVTVVGGIKSIRDAKHLFGAGADKIGINTEATKRPEFLNELAHIYGAQAVVSSIEAKFVDEFKDYFLFTESGRNNSGIRLSDWLETIRIMDIGEVLITSVDCDGMQRGPDLNLIQKTRELTDVPLVYSGGIATHDQAFESFGKGVDGICLASALHYKKIEINELKSHLSKSKILMREECLS